MAITDAEVIDTVRSQSAGSLAAPTAPMVETVLSLKNVTKTFPGVVANKEISLEINGGEVHAILGENGAGKSTLMKVIYGFYQLDSGSIRLNGQEVTIQSPNDSRRLGIGMVFQNFTLIPSLTVYENIALFLPHQGLFLDRKSLSLRIKEVSTRYGLDISPDSLVSELSMGERQKVELVKLALANARILIFDEPTSVLAPHEVQGLFRIFDELKTDGYAILFITHKIREVLAVADRATVLRRGEVVGTLPGDQLDPELLVSMMLETNGIEPIDRQYNPTTIGMSPVLEFANVSLRNETDELGLDDISFGVFPGEILGVAGVSGNGQQYLGEAIFGVRRKKSGSIRLFGDSVEGWPTSRLMKKGVSYITEDPLTMAVVPNMLVEENLVLGALQSYEGGGVWLVWSRLRQHIKNMLSGFPLALARHQARVSELSGGNVQRLVLAREMLRDVRALIAYYPTRGLDVNTAQATRRLILESRNNGTAVLLISEDLGELIELSDRMFVMYQGSIVGEFESSNADLHEIGRMMTGQAS